MPGKLVLMLLSFEFTGPRMTITRLLWTLISGVLLVQKGQSFLKDNLFSLTNIMDANSDIPILCCKLCSFCDVDDLELFIAYPFRKREITHKLFSLTNQKHTVVSVHIYKSRR